MANEVRLIDANALIEKAYWHGERPDPGNIYPDGVGAVDVSDIEDAPTIDPESLRPKGRWVMTVYTTTSKRGRVISNRRYACSECGYGNGRKRSNFCPNCGADMTDSKGEVNK